jgi:hypothetical protein
MGKTIFTCVYIGKKNFSRTSGPTSIKLGTNYLCIKGIKVCTNKGPGPLKRGDSCKKAKIRWFNLKYFFSRITKPEKLRVT